MKQRSYFFPLFFLLQVTSALSIQKLTHEELPIDPNFKIGICWESDSSTLPADQCLCLTDFSGLFALEGASVYELGAHYFSPDIALNEQPLIDPTGLLHYLDLIITCDRNIAHLAAALGKPTWVLMPQDFSCPCLVKEDGSPIYPSLRIMRAATNFSWQKIMDAVVCALQILVCKPKEPGHVYTEISVGELLDKITILELKEEKIKDPKKVEHVRKELNILMTVRDENIQSSHKLNILTDKLRAINLKLWDLSDKIRAKEAKQEFDKDFTFLARSIYFAQDERAEIRTEINFQFDSPIIEVKQYPEYKHDVPPVK